MRARDRFFNWVDRPLSWTRAIVGGFVLWVIVIILIGQVPSWLIYQADAKVATLIDISKHIPFVNEAGLNPTQIKIIRDIVANAIQFGFLAAILVSAYLWQKAKRRRLGRPDATDRVRAVEDEPVRKAG